MGGRAGGWDGFRDGRMGGRADFEGLIVRVVYYTVQQKHSVLYHP